MTDQRKTRNQRALVLGISKYPPPIPALPGVARTGLANGRDFGLEDGLTGMAL